MLMDIYIYTHTKPMTILYNGEKQKSSQNIKCGQSETPELEWLDGLMSQ